MTKQYLITGATSSLGVYLVKMLLEQGEHVRILADTDVDCSCFDGTDVEIFRGETFHKDTMKEFFTLDNPRECIFIHAEEQVSISQGKNLLMRRINVSGAVNVTDMCIKHKIGRLVYLSSAYALPVKGEQYVSGREFHFDRNLVEGDYAQTKAEASAYIMEKVSLNRYDAVLVLPTFMIGPGTPKDSDIGKVLNSYLNKEVAPVNGGHVFVDVRDVAAGIIAAAEKGTMGAGYILTGEYRSTVEFLNDVCEAAGVEHDGKMFPDWLLKKSVARFVDAYYKLTHKTNPKDVYAVFTTSSDARYETDGSDEVMAGAGGISIKDSIKDTVTWVNGTGA